MAGVKIKIGNEFGVRIIWLMLMDEIGEKQFEDNLNRMDVDVSALY